MKKIAVLVKPGSKKGPLVEKGADGLVVYVRERAVDGAANSAVIKVVAEYFGVPKSNLEITLGKTSKIKTVQITGIM